MGISGRAEKGRASRAEKGRAGELRGPDEPVPARDVKVGEEVTVYTDNGGELAGTVAEVRPGGLLIQPKDANRPPVSLAFYRIDRISRRGVALTALAGRAKPPGDQDRHRDHPAWSAGPWRTSAGPGQNARPAIDLIRKAEDLAQPASKRTSFAPADHPNAARG